MEAYLHTKKDNRIGNLNRQKTLINIRKMTKEAYLHTKNDYRNQYANFKRQQKIGPAHFVDNRN